MPIRKTTILTADDDPQLLRLIARNLELEDYQVLVASDGQQALEQIEQHAPDLVLLDVMLDLGADDYLTKPFSIEELLARVRAALRRAHFTASEQAHAMHTTTTIGDLSIEYAQHLVRMGEQEIELTPTEYRILAYLAQNAGHVVTQDLLLEHVWGSEYVGEGHMLQVNINRLRHKIEPDPMHPRYILTKVGIGYLLAARPDAPATQ